MHILPHPGSALIDAYQECFLMFISWEQLCTDAYRDRNVMQALHTENDKHKGSVCTFLPCRRLQLEKWHEIGFKK